MSITDTNGLAEHLKCSPRHVIDMKNQRLIPVIKLGRCVRFSIEDVEKALQKLTIREIS